MKVKKAKKNSKFITEEYLDKRLSLIVTKLDLNEAFEKHEEQHRKDRDVILTKMDEIAGDLQAKREDDAAGGKILEDHEERIKTLEQVA